MLPRHWRTVVLGDYAQITKGVSYKGAHLNEPGPLLVGLGEFIPGGGVKLDAVRTYAGEYRERHVARPGDILVALTDLTQSGAVLGSPLIVPPDTGAFCLYTHHVGRVAIREPESVDAPFLRYVLQDSAFSAFVSGRATGTTVRAVHPREVAQFEFALPPLDQQRAIARVLSALDHRIELNRRMSETVEEMAQALFRSWFVDFDPVRAKAVGRASGLPADLDALFPASFEPSELGEIPAGWEVTALGALADTVRGRSYRSAELAESGTALVTLKSFARGGGYRPEGVKPYTGRYQPEQIVKPGELVVACTDVTQAAEVIGRPAIVQRDERFETLVASLDVLIVRPRASSAVSVPFLYCLAKTPSFTSHTYSRVSGTTVLHLANDAVPSYAFPVPPPAILNAFNSLVGPVFSRKRDVASGSEGIRNVRDTLLPRLVSGELGVRRSNPWED